MSIRLRLSVAGRKDSRFFHIVAIDARKKRDGKVIEKLGYYNPYTKEMKINHDAVKYYQLHGAQISDGLARSLKVRKQLDSLSPETIS